MKRLALAVASAAALAVAAIASSCGPSACRSVCAGVCSNTDADPNNCGGCGNRCSTGLWHQGRCVQQWRPPAAICAGNRCVDKNNDPQNCGGCGIQCAANQACINANCVCRPGLSTCIPAGGGVPTCNDTTSDPFNCVSCGNTCTSGTQICK